MDLAKNKMGIQATSPSLNVQTTTPRTLAPKDTYTPPKTNPSVLTSSSTTPKAGANSNQLAKAPKVGTHVGDISNNPAFGPVGSIITREGLQKIASGQDKANPSPKQAYINAFDGGVGGAPAEFFANRDLNKTPANQAPSQIAQNPFGTGISGAGTIQTPQSTQTTPTTPPTGQIGANTGTPTPTPTPNGGALTAEQMAAGNAFTQQANSGQTSSAISNTQTTGGTTGGTTPPPGVDGTKWAGYLQELTNLRNQYQPALERKQKELADLAARQSQQIGGVQTQGGDASLQLGRAGVLQQLAAQQQAIKQKELDQLMSSYDRQAGILGQQIGATQPVAGASYFGTAETGGLKGEGNVFRAGQIAGQQSLGAQSVPMKAALDTASSYNQAIQQQLASTSLNNLPLNIANNAVQWIRGQIGDPQQKQLGNMIGNYVSTLQGAGLIGPDTAIGQQIVDTLAQGGSIASVLNNLQSIAQTKLQGIQNAGTGQSTPITTQTFTGGTGGLAENVIPKITYGTNGSITGMSF